MKIFGYNFYFFFHQNFTAHDICNILDNPLKGMNFGLITILHLTIWSLFPFSNLLNVTHQLAVPLDSNPLREVMFLLNMTSYSRVEVIICLPMSTCYLNLIYLGADPTDHLEADPVRRIFHYNYLAYRLSSLQ